MSQGLTGKYFASFGPPFDHGTLVGLADDDHPQYMTPAEHDAIGDGAPHHAAITVTDTASINLTLAGQNIQGDVIPGGIDHGGLAGLGDDDHPQYMTPAEHTAIGDGAPHHAAVTVTDTASINLTLVGQDIQGDVIPAGIDHGALAGIGDNDHPQYVLVVDHTKVLHDALAIEHGSLTGLGDDDHTQYQKESEKGAASGYASLDAGTKVPTAELGGAGADNTKYLRGDQTWAVPAGGGTGVFVARGDPAAWDWTIADFIRDSTWRDWDLSGVVPAGAKAVLLRMQWCCSQFRYFNTRPKGNANNVVNAALTSDPASFPASTHTWDFIIVPDANRFIQYWADGGAAWTVMNVAVAGWWGGQGAEGYEKGNDFAPHNMTSNSNPPPYIISASTEYSMLPAFKAFDGGLGVSQYWITDTGNPTGWLKIDIGPGNAKKLYSYKIYVNTIPEPARAPKAWTLYGSNNDADWTSLDSQSNQTGWGSGEGREFVLDSSKMETAYRYFKIDITENNEDLNYVQTGECYLYEAVPL